MSRTPPPGYHDPGANHAHQAWQEESRSLRGFRDALGALGKASEGDSDDGEVPAPPAKPARPDWEKHVRIVDADRAEELLRQQRRARRATIKRGRRSSRRRASTTRAAPGGSPPPSDGDDPSAEPVAGPEAPALPPPGAVDGHSEVQTDGHTEVQTEVQGRGEDRLEAPPSDEPAEMAPAPEELDRAMQTLGRIEARDELTDIDASDMHALGRTLQAERIHRGVTVDEVQQATKIPAPYLCALEEGRVDGLPQGPVFVQGYLRVYAHFMGLQPESGRRVELQTRAGDRPPVVVFEDEGAEADAKPDAVDVPVFDSLPADGEPVAPAPPGARVWGPVVAMVTRATDATRAAFARVKHRSEGRGRGWHAQRGRLGWAAAFVATVLLTMLVGSLVSGGGNGSSGPSSLSRPARRTPPASKPAAPPNVAAQQIAAIEPVSSDARGARFAVNQLPFTLTMVAKGSCWVQVRQGDGGPVVFEATLQTGQTKTVDGTGNLFLRLGNPNNVALTIGGRQVSMSVAPGTPYNVVFQAS
jgi:Helix-turn-helix domain/Domain of unknown function (DUF4115)